MNDTAPSTDGVRGESIMIELSAREEDFSSAQYLTNRIATRLRGEMCRPKTIANSFEWLSICEASGLNDLPGFVMPNLPGDMEVSE